MNYSAVNFPKSLPTILNVEINKNRLRWYSVKVQLFTIELDNRQSIGVRGKPLLQCPGKMFRQGN
jgi:hypothetical protein